jgi:hypothetical protein
LAAENQQELPSPSLYSTTAAHGKHFQVTKSTSYILENSHLIMNKIISVSSQPIVNLSAQSDRSQIEAERIQEVLILLTSLIGREEATIKLIIDCLYDIGSVNLINKKVRFRPINSVARFIAKSSKPVAKIFAWRWFTKNCPQLISQWLYRKVKFQ